jgi:predicted DNA-binding transcriptional regulator AlpA
MSAGVVPCRQDGVIREVAQLLHLEGHAGDFSSSVGEECAGLQHLHIKVLVHMFDRNTHLDATETCRVLGTSRRTLGRRVKAGTVPEPVRKDRRRYWPTDTIHELASRARTAAEASAGSAGGADQLAEQEPQATGGAQ